MCSLFQLLCIYIFIPKGTYISKHFFNFVQALGTSTLSICNAAMLGAGVSWLIGSFFRLNTVVQIVVTGPCLVSITHEGPGLFCHRRWHSTVSSKTAQLNAVLGEPSNISVTPVFIYGR